jgi:hypothetical protein
MVLDFAKPSWLLWENIGLGCGSGIQCLPVLGEFPTSIQQQEKKEADPGSEL